MNSKKSDLNVTSCYQYDISSTELPSEIYQIHDYNYILNILINTCDNLYSCQDKGDKEAISPLSWSKFQKEPIDEKISTCFQKIRDYICTQNNALLICQETHMSLE